MEPGVPGLGSLRKNATTFSSVPHSKGSSPFYAHRLLFSKTFWEFQDGDHSWVLESLLHFAMWPARQLVTDPLSLKLQLEPSWRLAAITYVGRRDVGGPEVSGAAFSASTSCLVSFSVCLSQENKNIPFLCAMFIQGWKPQRVTEGKMTILLVYALVSPDT